MCGIIGGINVEFNREFIKQIEHRGPDASNYIVNENIFLGHTRLSIQDLSEQGNQPMRFKNLTIIFNGEIYNHWSIRKELKSLGYSFSSSSDTETLLLGWHAWKEKIIERLNGIYAFAIFDKDSQKLFIARDPFGVKPLYIYQNNQEFIFGSELKSIISYNSFDPKVDITAIANYLTFLWSPGEQTMYQKVRRILPGEVISINVDTCEICNIDCLKNNFFNGNYLDLTESEWVDQVENHLLKAVELQMLSDVPVGFFLSGGLDSSLLVAMAKHIFPSKNFECFTMNAGNIGSEGFADDLPYAKKVARHLNVRLHEVSTLDMSVDSFDKMIWHLDEPQADLAPLNVLEISKLAKEMGIKVLIGGTAGDDIFSGYRRHRAINLETNIERFPKSVLRIIKRGVDLLPSNKPLARRLQKLSRDWGKPANQRIMGFFNWLPNDRIVFDILSKHQIELKNYTPYHYGLKILDGLDGNISLLDKMLILEQNTFLVDHNLNYTDKLSMAVGVEARVPYLDYELVKLAGRIPKEYKTKGKTTKYILKKVAEKYLPKDVIYRPKSGFGSPVRQMITSNFIPMIEERLSTEFLNKQGIFNGDEIHKMIRLNQQGKKDFGYTILSLLAIQSWLMQFKHEIN